MQKCVKMVLAAVVSLIATACNSLAQPRQAPEPARVEIVHRYEQTPAAPTPSAQQGEKWTTRTTQRIGPDGQTVWAEFEETREGCDSQPTRTNAANQSGGLGSSSTWTQGQREVVERELHAYDAPKPQASAPSYQPATASGGGRSRGNGLNFQVVPAVRIGPNGVRAAAIGTLDNHPIPTRLDGGYGLGGGRRGHGGGMSAAEYFGGR